MQIATCHRKRGSETRQSRGTRLKRGCALLLFALLCPILAPAQIDIPVSTRGNAYVTLGASLVWGSSGIGNANNYFVLSPLNPDQRYCLFLKNNNTTSAHAITLSAWQTGDTRQTTFANNASGGWVQDTLQPGITTIPANTVLSTYVHANAAARMAISVTGSTTQTGSPDTLDVFLVMTTADGCGPVIASSGAGTAIQCGGSSTTAFAIVRATLVSGVANQRIYVCAATATAEVAFSTPAAVLLTSGPSGCASNNKSLWGFDGSTTVGAVLLSIGSGSGILMVTNPGDDLCVDNTASLSGTTRVSVSFLRAQ